MNVSYIAGLLMCQVAINVCSGADGTEFATAAVITAAKAAKRFAQLSVAVIQQFHQPEHLRTSSQTTEPLKSAAAANWIIQYLECILVVV